MPHRAPGSPGHARTHLGGRPVRYDRPTGSEQVRDLVGHGFQTFNAGRLGEACRICSEKMLSAQNDTTIGALNFTLHRGSPFLDDRELYDDGIVRICDVLVPATVLLETDAHVREGQPTLWEVYGIPKGGNDFFIQITTDQVVWGGLSGATPSEAASWGKVNPGVLPDTAVTYCDSTIVFPLFCEYALASPNNRRPLKGLVHKRDALVADLTRQVLWAQAARASAGGTDDA